MEYTDYLKWQERLDELFGDPPVDEEVDEFAEFLENLFYDVKMCNK